MTPEAGEFLRIVRAGDLAAVDAALRRDPALARLRDDNGVSVVCLAVYASEDAVAERIARLRDDLDIFEASTLGDARAVAELADRDPALVDAYSPDGFHPLGYACFFGRLTVAEALLARGAQLEAPARNPMRVRPLHSAVAQADADLALRLAQRLLEAGASPNVVQQGGFTPLHEASLRGHAEMVAVLLQQGADAAARNTDGRTAADLARDRGASDVLSLLARKR